MGHLVVSRDSFGCHTQVVMVELVVMIEVRDAAKLPYSTGATTQIWSYVLMMPLLQNLGLS